MKIRNGFVSNSSSSSFCIYGADVTACEEETLINKIKELFPEANLDHHRGLADLFEIIQKKTALEFHSVSGEYYYMGKSWCAIGDNETGSQFKSTIEAEMKKLFGDSIQCGTIDQAWYNG